MKKWLLKFTGFVVQYGGMLAGVMYLHQAWSISELPMTAKGISLPAFCYLGFMQANMFVYAFLKSDKRMAVGFGSAFIGAIAVIVVTIFFR